MILQFINKPYPFLLNIKEKLFLRLFIAVFVLLVCIILRPFELAEYTFFELITTSMINAAFVFISISLSQIIFKYFIPNIEEEDWTILKEIIVFFWHILFLGFLSYGFNWIVGNNYDFNFWIRHSVTRPLLGALLLLPLILLIKSYFVIKKKHNSIGLIENILQIKRVKKNNRYEAKINLNGNNTTDDNVFNITNLILFNSVGNYVHVYYLENNQLNKKLVRITLKQVLEHLSGFDSFFQCHRSYIINTDRIISFKGNAKGYKVELENIEFTVPVSRLFIDSFKKHLNNS